MIRDFILSRAIGVFLPLVLAGCIASPATVDWGDPGLSRAWPAPPAPPRIALLRVVDGPRDVVGEGRGKGFLKWLSGDKGIEIPLLSPFAVTADGRGRIWITDTSAKLIHVYDLARQRVDYILQAGDFAFLSPQGVAWDEGTQRLYVADSELGKVFVLDGKYRLVEERQPPEPFQRPVGLAFDSGGNLFVVDALKRRVEVFSPGGDHLQTIGGQLPPDQALSRPTAIAIDGEGRLLVVDSFNFRVQLFSGAGEPLGTIGGLGDVPGTFARPRGIAVDSQGHIYVADAAFDNIQVFDSAGRLLLYFGRAGKDPGDFNLPAGLFFDGEDRLYVVDAFNQRLQVFQYLPSPH